MPQFNKYQLTENEFNKLSPDDTIIVANQSSNNCYKCYVTSVKDGIVIVTTILDQLRTYRFEKTPRVEDKFLIKEHKFLELFTEILSDITHTQWKTVSEDKLYKIDKILEIYMNGYQTPYWLPGKRNPAQIESKISTLKDVDWIGCQTIVLFTVWDVLNSYR
jgi:hypothetical protein